MWEHIFAGESYRIRIMVPQKLENKVCDMWMGDLKPILTIRTTSKDTICSWQVIDHLYQEMRFKSCSYFLICRQGIASVGADLCSQFGLEGIGDEERHKILIEPCVGLLEDPNR